MVKQLIIIVIPKLRIKIPCMSCNGRGQSININGDYLIDDRTKNGAGDFEGTLIQFGTPSFNDWKSVIEFLLEKEIKKKNGRSNGKRRS